MIRAGIINEGKMNVTEESTAAEWGSGTLPVFATPAMILLVERTASECLMPFLKEGESTVGTSLDIRHSAPSVVGSEVFCRVELVEADRSRMVFDVKVWDSAGEVGSGKHERFVVNNEKFMARADSRKG
ncbi:MAG: thioesterase family protein [Candidatus Methanoplasma sp.]|jgi:predicted thioesterase|nr:thioesterase family protein [Candidatus Methanoplasma sp.]